MVIHALNYVATLTLICKMWMKLNHVNRKTTRRSEPDTADWTVDPKPRVMYSGVVQPAPLSQPVVSAPGPHTSHPPVVLCLEELG